MKVGQVEKCARCGRTIRLKSTGTVGSGPAPSGTTIYQWCARKGTKPAPIYCPVSDGWPTTYHAPDGQPVVFYGDPSDPVTTR